MQAFLRLQRRNSCKCSFTAVPNGGKAPAAGFPPLTEEETGRCSFTAPCSGGKAAAWFPSVPLPSSVSFLSFFFHLRGRGAHKNPLYCPFPRHARIIMVGPG
ncbi:hypothetical protein AAC387_Pa03g3244 [Persea americana]